MDQYYSIREIEKIDFMNPKSHMTECETLDEVKNFPDTKIIVIKKKLNGRNGIGSNFYYPNVYSYKIVNLEGIPFLLKTKNNRTSDFLIETFTSGYPEDKGWGEINIFDTNDISRLIRIEAGFNDSAVFVLNIMQFLFNFESEFSSNWKLYDLINEKDDIIKSLEKENVELKEEIAGLNLKLKAAKKIK